MGVGTAARAKDQQGQGDVGSVTTDETAELQGDEAHIQFTDAGAIPAVDSSAPATPGPTASELGFGKRTQLDPNARRPSRSHRWPPPIPRRSRC